MDHNIDMIVYNIILENNPDKVNNFIRDYQPFIIKVASEIKNGYIDAHNDEELSIALMAFHESMEKYDYEKGSFLSFARLIISNRLKNYWKSENRFSHDDIDNALEISVQEEQYELQSEIHSFEKELLKFNITFDDLIQQSPLHLDTRERAIHIGRATGSDDNLMQHLYSKKRLPITQISNKFKVSVKIIKRSKTFIIGTALVVYNKFTMIGEWLQKKGPKF
ncbi:MAG: RNA polymerase subunit sigma [Clostridia bacterium]|nr:RNA polymerase subunit sigma [Clostridia bacterium]